MTSERFHILNLKRKFFNSQENIANPKPETLQNVNERMLEIRMTASLNRLNAFKKAVQKSGWYYNLIQRMISENIHEKPLTKFMAGKFALRLTYSYVDQIKNVIESGQVYNQEHFETLLSSMQERDIRKEEV